MLSIGITIFYPKWASDLDVSHPSNWINTIISTGKMDSLFQSIVIWTMIIVYLWLPLSRWSPIFGVSKYGRAKFHDSSCPLWTCHIQWQCLHQTNQASPHIHTILVVNPHDWWFNHVLLVKIGLGRELVNPIIKQTCCWRGFSKPLYSSTNQWEKDIYVMVEW